MKINNKTVRSRMARAALLLGVILSTRTVDACWTTLPQPCADYFNQGKCKEGKGFMDSYVTGASFYDQCTDAGSHTYGTSQTCYQTGPTVPCTYTIHVDFCDGSSSDTPESDPINSPDMNGTCSS